MSNYTSLGEWSDGEDDWIFEINEHEVLREFNKSNTEDGIDDWNNSEDDELIRNINEDEILRGVNDGQTLETKHTGQGEKRQNVNLSDSEDEPSKKRRNQNVVSSDTDPTPAIGDEESNNEDQHIPPTTSERTNKQDREKNVRPRTRTWNKKIIIASNLLRIIIHENSTWQLKIIVSNLTMLSIT